MQTTITTKHRQEIELVNRKIAEKLLIIFKNCVGREKSINKILLYAQVFNNKYDHDSPTAYLRWQYVKRAMHYLRLRSNCFIMSTIEEGTYNYYIPTNQKDIDEYDIKAINSINKIKAMQYRARKSVGEQWYKQTWTIKNE